MQLSDFIAHENVDRKIEIQETIQRLGHIDRAVLYLWVIGYTQEEIAHIFGYSREHINRMLAKMSHNVSKTRCSV